ncbi:MAG: mechanosensitive ion channel family protein [Deltaproteobacteria bacterium]|nr:mechanosensitive ion channel family protein [Deltaproteobacteria bacterium]
MMLSHWARDTLPSVFVTVHLFDLELWQVLTLPVMLLASYLVARVASKLFTRVALRLSVLTTAKWDDLLVENLASPLRLFFTGVFALLLLPTLDAHTRAMATLTEILRITMLVAGFWAVLRAVDIGHESLRTSLWVKARPATLPVFALVRRILKIAIFVLGVVTVLQQLGYPIAGILAGLGVGGLAVALAAQKTLENLLGSVMLSIDQPFRVGDTVLVDGTLGTVESIGLRSTQIRTAARTLVTIPNGKLADSKIENLAPRERLQLVFTLGLNYATTRAQLEAIIDGVRALLADHPHTFKDGIFVHLRDLGDSALVLEVNTWFTLPDDVDFREVKQGVLLGALAIVAAQGATLAYPTRTIVSAKAA